MAHFGGIIPPSANELEDICISVSCTVCAGGFDVTTVMVVAGYGNCTPERKNTARSHYTPLPENVNGMNAG
jgi:hypothetical protein